MIDYDKTKDRFDKYIERCKRTIENMLFSEEELSKAADIKSDNIAADLAREEDDLETVLKEHRKRLIQIKIDHTMRVVADVTKIANSVGAPIDFVKTVEVAGLLHDIGRFKQAMLNNGYDDGIDKKTGLSRAVGFGTLRHAQYGQKMLSELGMFDYYEIPDRYRFAIGEVVAHHQDANITGDYATRFIDGRQLDTDKFLTGSQMLNEHEKIIVAALLQMVKDVDMIDILYQNISGEMPTVRQSVEYRTADPVTGKQDTLDEIAAHWGLDPKVIKDYNKLESDDISGRVRLSIPIKEMSPSKLEVPLDIQKRFFNNEDLDLQELQRRRDWTFITGMWWRLNHFLNGISFISNLELMEQNEVLEKIYATYPDEYKPLVAPAFEFAKEKLLGKVIRENKGEIYVKRRYQ